MATIDEALATAQQCARASRSKIYSVPRRFDLAMIFVVTAVYSLLFGVMSALQFPPVASLAIGGFFTLVAICQALLFRGQRPRSASIFVGVAVFSLSTLAFWLANGQRLVSTEFFLSAAVSAVVGGAIIGYVAGALIGSVFLVADVLRRRFDRRAKHTAEAPAKAS